MKRFLKTLSMLIAHSTAKLVTRRVPSYRRFAQDSRELQFAREYEL